LQNKNRNKRAKISEETLQIVKNGFYEYDKKRVELAELIKKSVASTFLVTPSDTLNSTTSEKRGMIIEVVNETTLQGAKRLSDSKKYKKIGVLNFASAKNAGGGFLGGSQAQEESLARNSALYVTLESQPDYYYYHRRVNKSLLYSNHIIYSPNCPVFRLDDGELLSEPYVVDFITSPAPNYGAIAENEPHSLEKIDKVFQERIALVLRLALTQGCDALVLGAWGCGVFRNDPEKVATFFSKVLLAEGEFAHAFDYVSFSIPENRKVALNSKAFESLFK